MNIEQLQTELLLSLNKPRPCEDCNSIVVNRKCSIRRNGLPDNPHWRITCNNCHKTAIWNGVDNYDK